MIERPYYLDRLTRLRGTGLVKVLTGMRRVGKSGILRLFERSLLEEGVEADRIVLVNLELGENAPLRDAQQLLEFIRERTKAQANEHPIYVLIDEAQEVPGMGRVAYALQEDGRYDLYLTGSHSHLVERELADIMSGRYVEIPVFSLSFAEYHAAHMARGTTTTTNQLFQRYLQHGGLPYVLALEDDPYALRDYLDGVYHTVVRRDVATDMGHEDPLLLDAITRQLMGRLGQPTTANGLSKALSASGKSCSDDTVSVYVAALAHAYAFQRLRRFDLKSSSLLKTKEKYYASDLGLRTLMLGAQGTSLAGLLENVVYLELRRRYAEVHSGKHYARQISFVVQGDEGRAYFEVVPSVLDPATLARALEPMRAERDNYPKTLLTLDEIGLASHEGIRQENLVAWLLSANRPD